MAIKARESIALFSTKEVYDEIYAQNIRVGDLEANSVTTQYLTANYITATDIAADYASISTLQTDYLTATQIAAAYVSTNRLETDYLSASEIAASYITTNTAAATYATITELGTVNTRVDGKADINLLNVQLASGKALITSTGYINTATITDLTADSLRLRGKDGLYYAINVDEGEVTTAQADANLNKYGRYITGKSIIDGTIVAQKLYVDDLSAIHGTFGTAMIGGLTLESSSIHSDNKTSISSGTGLYIDSAGRMGLVGTNGSILFYDDANDNNKRKLSITADQLFIGTTNMSTVASEVSTTSSNLASYISSNNTAINNLQSQIDGQIEAWYIHGAPNTTQDPNPNDPALAWNTLDLKRRHLGDLYFDVDTGHSWRYLATNTESASTYSWERIPDSDAAAALALAQSIADTAVTDITYEYATNTSPATAPTSGWSTTVPTWSEGAYIWQRRKTTVDGSVTITDTVCLTGHKGETGASGAAGTKIWTTTVAPTTPNYTFTISNLSGDGTGTPIRVGDIIIYSYYRYSVTSVSSTTVLAGNRVSIRGASGAAGTGISSVTYFYATTTTQTAPAAANVTSTTIPTMSATNKYLWQKEVIAYTSGDPTTTVSLIAVYGDQGTPGQEGSAGRGISSITYRYATTTTQTAPTAANVTSTTIPTMSATNKYLWQKETIAFTSGSDQVTVLLIAVYGDQGPQGPQGNQGPQGPTGAKGNGYVYIEDTQTGTNAAWTGSSTELTSLSAGTQILFHLNHTSAANVTLNLTLNGVATGAKNVYNKGTTRLGTEYTTNSMVPLVYDGTSWYVAAPYTNSNTYDRTRFNNAIKMAVDSTEYGIYVGTSSGYREAGSGVTFDINYPPVYYNADTLIAANSTTTNTYIAMPSVSLRNTKAGIALTSNQMAYLKGTLNGNIFTIHSDVFANAPTTADGFLYIPVGILYSTYQIYFQSSRELYKYDEVRGFGLLQNATVVSVTKQYYLHTNAETAPGAGVTWLDDVPTIDATKFLWTRDKITYTTGDPGYTNLTCVTSYTADIVRPDLQDVLSEANQYSAGLITEERSARLEALESYVLKTSYNEFVSSTQNSIAVNAQGIEARATKTEVSQIVDDLGEVQQFRREVGNYMTFDATNGLTLSALNSSVKTVLDNSSWKLKIQDTVVQQVDATNGAQFSSINIKALTAGAIPSLVLGNLTIVVETDGSVTGRKT